MIVIILLIIILVIVCKNSKNKEIKVKIENEQTNETSESIEKDTDDISYKKTLSETELIEVTSENAIIEDSQKIPQNIDSDQFETQGSKDQPTQNSDLQKNNDPIKDIFQSRIQNGEIKSCEKCGRFYIGKNCNCSKE